MKKFTQEDFDNFEIIDGYRQCPTGDYTNIEKFGSCCSFSLLCSFGERCFFGKECLFGDWCSFGGFSSFKGRCSFGGECSFGDRCSFGLLCLFSEGCSFGERCSFSNDCSFGERCSFGESCSFEGVGKSKSGYPFLAFTGFGSRVGNKVCFFNLEEGIYVRCGCFLGTIEEFENKVRNTGADTDYLIISELVRKRFENKASS
ncbi:MAG: zinc finger CCCH domain-containing protein [Phocaeicola sp.]